MNLLERLHGETASGRENGDFSSSLICHPMAPVRRLRGGFAAPVSTFMGPLPHPGLLFLQENADFRLKMTVM
jgi:hypothetical protein